MQPPRNLVCLLALTAAITLVAGCASSNSPPRATLVPGESGPNGTVVYAVPVDASVPGARIQVNGTDVGVTPMVLKINGDRDGTFHNFGSYDFIVRAYPPDGGHSLTKVFRTGALMAKEDRIPEKIYFDFGGTTNTSPTQPKEQ
jgi:hypothetical protein